MRVQHGLTPVRESQPHISTAAADSSTLGAAVRPEPLSTGTGLQGDSVILSPVKIRDVYLRGLRTRTGMTSPYQCPFMKRDSVM